MRLALVVRFGNDTRPNEGVFEGWVEEVDSCTERLFRSTEELLKFLGERLDLDSHQPIKRKREPQRGNTTWEEKLS
jgi:hypothetical protein